MKILFDLVNVGLGNNGGSSTLIKSANTLLDLGQEVIFIDSFKNHHTWTDLKAKHIIIKNKDDIPEVDCIIGTGFKSWRHVLNLPKEKGNKYIWLRGWELWQASENKLYEILKNENLKILVNSIGLQKKLKVENIDSKIIRPGNNFTGLYPMNLRYDDNIILGGLYHTKHKTKRSDWIIEAAKVLKKHYKNVKLFMFGTSAKPNNPIIDEYYQSPSLKEKNIFFNKVDIFLSPTNLEGLHIVPQEAMATECPVIGTNAELAGLDYVEHGRNGLISKDNFKSFVDHINTLIKNKSLRVTLGLNAGLDIRKFGNRGYNMQQLINYLSSYKR